MPKGIKGTGQKLFPATIEVKCGCERMVNVRIDKPTRSVPCWYCRRTITVNLYAGYGKYSAYVDGIKASYSRIIWQGTK